MPPPMSSVTAGPMHAVDRRIIVGMRGRKDLVGRVVIVEGYATQSQGRLRVRLADGEDEGQDMSVKEENLMREDVWHARLARERLLSKGCVKLLFGRNRWPKNIKPVVQLIALYTRNMIRNANTRQEHERIKCHLSDGVHFGVGVLAPEAASLVIQGKLRAQMLVALTDYTVSVIAGLRLCLIIGLEITCAEQEERIGEPQPWDALAPVPKAADPMAASTWEARVEAHGAGPTGLAPAASAAAPSPLAANPILAAEARREKGALLAARGEALVEAIVAGEPLDTHSFSARQ